MSNNNGFLKVNNSILYLIYVCIYDIKMGIEKVHIPAFAKKFCFCETAEISSPFLYSTVFPHMKIFLRHSLEILRDIEERHDKMFP